MSAPVHRTAAIVSIGDELILGQTLDTNARWLSAQLLALAIRPVEHVTIDDDELAISASLQRLAARVDLILTTGGLGPTADDLTRAGLARAMGETLIEDSLALREIREWYAARGREVPPTNRVQALRPESARRLPNTRGTAPGLAAPLAGETPLTPPANTAAAEPSGAEVYCLPGPPGELRGMFEDLVAPELHPPADVTIATRVLHTFGLGESDVAARLDELMARDRTPMVGTTASGGVVSVRIRHEGQRSRAEAEELLDATESAVRERLGDIVFASGEDATLESAVLDRLRERSATIAVVESCTGGLLAESLTRIPGSSEAFLGGWTTYTNAMKQGQLGVPRHIFEPETGASEPPPGAVSRPCAEAMATGGLERAEADHCLAITGIAGPSGGTPDKPVGTVWIALASREPGAGVATDVRRFHFRWDRDKVRLWSARAALGMLRLRLDGLSMPLLAQVEPEPEIDTPDPSGRAHPAR